MLSLDRTPFSTFGSFLSISTRTPTEIPPEEGGLMLAGTLDRTPFSTSGSFYSVSHAAGDGSVDQERRIFLRSHHGERPSTIIQLVPLRDGQPVPVETRLDAAVLSLMDDHGGRIDVCFDGVKSLRFRGLGGLGLRLFSLVGWTVAYSTGDGLVTLNISTLRRYQVESLSGQMEARGLWRRRQDRAAEVFVDLLPGDDGEWEAAFDEYWSTWIPRPRPDFASCVSAAQSDFDEWLAATLPAPAELGAARREAAYVNWSSIVGPEGLLGRPAMLMSKNWMDNVWSWDHCFNAMALARGNGDLAWDQLLVMVDHQDEFGAYPDAINDVYKHYNYSKPPVHGWTTLELLRWNPAAATPGRVQTMYDSLTRWTQWWLTHRRLPGQTLPFYLHGNDSGWDNSTMFDQGVPLIAPDLAALLIEQVDALSILAERLGREEAAIGWRKQADELLAALLDELWKGDHFVARLAVEGQDVASRSLIPCMPVLLGRRLPSDVRDHLAKNIESFLTAYGPATEHPQSPEYTSDGYWRGPIWAPSTYIVVTGLVRCGYTALARRISERFCAMCAESGFAENFDALTGAPLRDPAYTWTASIFLLLAEPLSGE
jgi:hypothetical protein